MAKPVQAVLAKDLPEWKAHVDQIGEDASRLGKLKSKKFEELAKDEKDLLLKALAVRFEFVLPSKDK